MISDNPEDPKGRRRVEITAADRDRISQLMYQRWVNRNAEAVAKASEVRSVTSISRAWTKQGLELFIRSLYSDHFDKDAIVLDVRYNSGGFTHDQVLELPHRQGAHVFPSAGWRRRNRDA